MMEPPLWLVDVSSWDPSQAEFDQAVDQFCDPARAKAVRKFVERADQKRALLSTLLQRKACCEVAGVSGSEVAIERTKGMKPYGVVPRDISRPNFNFNASHDGDYVVLCAHPHYLCGVDVCHVERVAGVQDSLVAMLCPRGRGVLSQLSGLQRELYLFLSFSAKEAVTKAIGVGMAREFEGLTFEPDLPEHWASPGCEEHMMFRLVTRERLPNMQKKEWAAPKEEGSWCLGVRWVEGADGLHVVVTACGAAKWCVDGIGKFKAQLLQPELCPTRASDGVFSYSEVSMAELLASAGGPGQPRNRTRAPTGDTDYTRRATESEEDDDLGYFMGGEPAAAVNAVAHLGPEVSRKGPEVDGETARSEPKPGVSVAVAAEEESPATAAGVAEPVAKQEVPKPAAEEAPVPMQEQAEEIKTREEPAAIDKEGMSITDYMRHAVRCNPQVQEACNQEELGQILDALDVPVEEIAGNMRVVVNQMKLMQKGKRLVQRLRPAEGKVRQKICHLTKDMTQRLTAVAAMWDLLMAAKGNTTDSKS